MTGAALTALAHDFDHLLSVEETKLLRQVLADVSRSAMEASARGALHSSVAINQAAQAAARSIPIFAHAAFNLLTRTATAHAVIIDRSNREDFEGLLTSRLDQYAGQLVALVGGSPALKNSKMISSVQAASERINGDTALELKRLGGELRLIATANDRRPQSADGSSMIFNGPVGVVQAGPGSFAAVHQVLDATGKAELARAFDTLAAAIQEHRSSLPVDTDELDEVIQDGKMEISKPKPNQLRLRSILSGIGSTISFVPKLKDAYDTMKWAAGFVGLTLP